MSSTLDTLDWGPATLVRGDLADELGQLKQHAGNIQMPGSPTLVRSPLRAAILDEPSLGIIVPLLVGPGTRLLEEIAEQARLELVDSRALSTGVVAVTLRPVSTSRARRCNRRGAVRRDGPEAQHGARVDARPGRAAAR